MLKWILTRFLGDAWKTPFTHMVTEMNNVATQDPVFMDYLHYCKKKLCLKSWLLYLGFYGDSMVFLLFFQDKGAEGRGRIARIQRRLLVVDVEKKIMQFQMCMDQGLVICQTLNLIQLSPNHVVQFMELTAFQQFVLILSHWICAFFYNI